MPCLVAVVTGWVVLWGRGGKGGRGRRNLMQLLHIGTPDNTKWAIIIHHTLGWATAGRVEWEGCVRDYVSCTNKRLQVHLWRCGGLGG